YAFRKWQFLLIILAGTVVRFLYGYWSKAWLAAPDQLAWGLSLDEMANSKTWSYIQLTHAPHEGGSFFISLLSFLFRPLQWLMPPLSFAALAIDTLSRAIQVKLAQKLFGNETAVWFGIWTILSIPLILPWGTVNYGLHSLSSFFPFMFLYFATTFRQNKYLPAMCAIISAIAISVSYDNVVPAIASVLFLFFTTQPGKKRAYRLLIFLAFFLITILPHLFTRIYFNSGFSLVGGSSFSIRGVPLGHLFTSRHLIDLCTVWFTSLPASFLLASVPFLPAIALCILVSVFVFAGSWWYMKNRTVDKPVRYLSLCIIFLFVVAYAFSPFYGGSYQKTSYVYYRHWCYIIPFITVIMINGFVHSGRLKLYIVAGWILLCSVASLQYIRSSNKMEQPVYRAAGWVLANKYGNNLDKLFQIHSVAPNQYQEELLMGYGWGLSAAIFKNSSDAVSVEKLISIISQCPRNYQPLIISGVYYSFEKGITPVLDQQLPAIISARLAEKNKDSK
ncbi:MAG: hypothetical protein JWQ30_1388, partial [Sediminibacterium sp.]|nr:hypothetical protein [Sediminibacterium sp.]